MFLVESSTWNALGIFPIRKGGRVVEGSGLENRRAGNRIVGSNPTLSARDLL